jgi:hypothetical protein
MYAKLHPKRLTHAYSIRKKSKQHPVEHASTLRFDIYQGCACRRNIPTLKKKRKQGAGLMAIKAKTPEAN